MASGFTQWRVLTRRTLETFLRNRLTLAILVGSPALVVGMFAILFRPGAFDIEDPSPSSMVMIGFWIVFAAFFFGLTYGLLQICTERTILRRERLVGLRLGAYVASKVTVLVPFLLLVIVAMLGVLRLLDRLPHVRCRRTRRSASACCCARSPRSASACSRRRRSATSRRRRSPFRCCASPRCCSPAPSSRCTSWRQPAPALSVRDPVALGLRGHRSRPRGARILAEGGSPLGPPLLSSYGDAGTQSTGTYWLILGAFAVVFLVATWLVLVRGTRRSMR